MSGYRLQLNSPLIHAVILLAISLPYCINLGKSSIWDSNEAFYAETPREMLVTGNYLAPQFNFQPRAQKPPLTYWIVLASYKLFGVNEFAVRVPGALAAIGIFLFSYSTAKLLFGLRAALIAAVATATTARIFILARRLPIDILLLFFLTASFYFLIRAIQKNERTGWILAYVSVSLGFLTKGPVALVIPAGAYLAWILWGRRIKSSTAHPLMGAAVFILIAIPWYILIYKAHGWTYISPFFLRDNLGRFASESMGPARGPFYYFSVYLTDFFPWSLLVLVAVILLWVDRKKEPPLRSLSFGFPLIWCALTFFLFSLSKNKQEYYIAPIYPVAAVIISGALDRILRNEYTRGTSELAGDPKLNPQGVVSGSAGTPRSSLWAWGYGFLAFFLVLLSLILPYILSAFIPDVPPMLHYAPSLVFIGGAVQLTRNIGRGKFSRCFPALAIPLWAIFFMGALFYVPALESFRYVKGFCSIIEAQSVGNDEAGFFRIAAPSMVFYLQRPIFEESNFDLMIHRFRSSRRIFCILDKKDYVSFADKKVTLHVLGRHSRYAMRLGSLLDAGHFPEEELLLVSNRPYQKHKSRGSRPRL